MTQARCLPLKAKVSSAVAAFLRMWPAEAAHDFSISALAAGLGDFFLPGQAQDIPSWHFGADLRTTLPGIGSCLHPIGLAAGLDKNGKAIPAWSKFGFSFCEIGTVTPEAQPGNSKPRLFRLKSRRALINRMGFNNEGAQALVRRVRALTPQEMRIPLGINLGKGKATPIDQALRDYEIGFAATCDLSQYHVVNISSPNTPGLRALANPAFIKQLGGVFGARIGTVWIKLDPDLGKIDFQKNVEAAAECGFAGVILTNTHRVEWPEAGGLSGHALSALSNTFLEWAFEVHRGKLHMIGSGGILDGSDIFQKVIRGASAVQIYTGLIYRGPWAVWEMLGELAAELKLRGYPSLAEAKGAFFRND